MTMPAPNRPSTPKGSPILATAGRAAERRAAGRDIANLARGEPDFAPPPHVADSVVDTAALEQGCRRIVAAPGDAA